MSDYTRWTADGMDVAGLVSQCISLDVKNAAAALPGRGGKRHGGGGASGTKGASTTTVDLALPPPVLSPGSGVATPKEALKSVQAAPPLRKEESTASVMGPLPGDEHEIVEPPTAGDPTDRNPSPPIQELVATHVALKSAVVEPIASPPLLEHLGGVTSSSSESHTPDVTHLSPRLHYVDFESGGTSDPNTPLIQPGSPPVVSSSVPQTPQMGPSPRLRFKSFGGIAEFGGMAGAGGSTVDVTSTISNPIPIPSSGVGALTVEPHHAISSLQREVLLLRNELNFELWLKKQHLSHMGKLHRDRIVARSEEAERQNLVSVVIVVQCLRAQTRPNTPICVVQPRQSD